MSNSKNGECRAGPFFFWLIIDINISIFRFDKLTHI